MGPPEVLYDGPGDASGVTRHNHESAEMHRLYSCFAHSPYPDRWQREHSVGEFTGC